MCGSGGLVALLLFREICRFDFGCEVWEVVVGGNGDCQ